MLKPLVLSLALLASSGLQALEALDDGALAEVRGQQGVLLNIKLRNNVDASNTPIGCTAAVGTPNPCRMGLEFAARAGTWLMLKEYYGIFQLKNLRLDTTFLPANTSYYNSSRFRDGSNNCLLPSCNPSSRPAIKMGFPGTDGTAVYDDFLSFMNIGRLWLEFDTAVEPAGTRGFMRDTSLNSVMGSRMSDSGALNAAAKMRFMGTAYVYGF